MYIVLWPLFHYLVWTNDSNGKSEKQYWEDYVAVNHQFAQVIASQYRPGDISKFFYIFYFKQKIAKHCMLSSFY